MPEAKCYNHRMEDDIRQLEQHLVIAPTTAIADSLLRCYDLSDQIPDPDIAKLLLNLYQEEKLLDSVFRVIQLIPLAKRRKFLEQHAKETQVWYGLLLIDGDELNYWNKFLNRQLEESYLGEIYGRSEEKQCYTYNFSRRYFVDVKIIGGEEPYVDAPIFSNGTEFSVADPASELDGDYYFKLARKARLMEFILRVKES